MNIRASPLLLRSGAMGHSPAACITSPPPLCLRRVGVCLSCTTLGRVDAFGPAKVPGLRTEAHCPAALAVGEAGLSAPEQRPPGRPGGACSGRSGAASPASRCRLPAAPRWTCKAGALQRGGLPSERGRPAWHSGAGRGSCCNFASTKCEKAAHMERLFRPRRESTERHLEG